MTAKPNPDSNVNSDTASVLYRMLRIARDQFDKQLIELTVEEQKRAESIAAHEYLLEQAVLASREANDVVIPDSQVEQALQQVKVRYQSAQEFDDELSDNGLTILNYKSALQRSLRVESVLDYISSKSPQIGPTEVELYYCMHPEKFQLPELRTARQILITINDDIAENKRQASLQKIQQIHQRVTKKPARFAEQASKHSECPTAMQEGLLGQIKRDTLYPELEAALFSLPENGISDIIETELGFHILYCENIQTAGRIALEDVQKQLAEQLQAQQTSRYVRRWIQQKLKERHPTTENQ